MAGVGLGPALDAITQIIRYGQAASVFRGDDPHLIASSIWVSGYRVTSTRTAPHNPAHASQNGQRSYVTVLDLLIRGIQSE